MLRRNQQQSQAQTRQQRGGKIHPQKSAKDAKKVPTPLATKINAEAKPNAARKSGAQQPGQLVDHVQLKPVESNKICTQESASPSKESANQAQRESKTPQQTKLDLNGRVENCSKTALKVESQSQENVSAETKIQRKTQIALRLYEQAMSLDTRVVSGASPEVKNCPEDQILSAVQVNEDVKMDPFVQGDLSVKMNLDFRVSSESEMMSDVDQDIVQGYSRAEAKYAASTDADTEADLVAPVDFDAIVDSNTQLDTRTQLGLQSLANAGAQSDPSIPIYSSLQPCQASRVNSVSYSDSEAHNVEARSLTVPKLQTDQKAKLHPTIQVDSIAQEALDNASKRDDQLAVQAKRQANFRNPTDQETAADSELHANPKSVLNEEIPLDKMTSAHSESLMHLKTLSEPDYSDNLMTPMDSKALTNPVVLENVETPADQKTTACLDIPENPKTSIDLETVADPQTLKDPETPPDFDAQVANDSPSNQRSLTDSRASIDFQTAKDQQTLTNLQLATGLQASIDQPTIVDLKIQRDLQDPLSQTKMPTPTEVQVPVNLQTPTDPPTQANPEARIDPEASRPKCAASSSTQPYFILRRSGNHADAKVNRLFSMHEAAAQDELQPDILTESHSRQMEPLQAHHNTVLVELPGAIEPKLHTKMAQPSVLSLSLSRHQILSLPYPVEHCGAELQRAFPGQIGRFYVTNSYSYAYTCNRMSIEIAAESMGFEKRNFLDTIRNASGASESSSQQTSGRSSERRLEELEDDLEKDPRLTLMILKPPQMKWVKLKNCLIFERSHPQRHFIADKWQMFSVLRHSASLNHMQMKTASGTKFDFNMFILYTANPGNYQRDLMQYLDRHPGTYILKRTNYSQGIGIRIYQAEKPNTVEKIRKCLGIRSGLQQYVLQKYIERPLLVDKRKFDLRVYMLLLSCKRPLPNSAKGFENSYFGFCYPGYVKLSCYPYSQVSRDMMVHLTNQFVQKQRQSIYTKVKEATTWFPDELNDYLNRRGRTEADWCQKRLYSQIRTIIGYVAAAFRPHLDSNASPANVFRLYGPDFIIDEDLRVWLLEVNTFPSYAKNTEALSGSIRNMWREAVTLSAEATLRYRNRLPVERLTTARNFHMAYSSEDPLLLPDLVRQNFQ